MSMNNIARPDCCIGLGRRFSRPICESGVAGEDSICYIFEILAITVPGKVRENPLGTCFKRSTNFVSLIPASDVIINKSRLSGCIEYFIYFRLPCSVQIFRFQPYPPNMDSSYPDDDLAYLSSGSSSSDSVDGIFSPFQTPSLMTAHVRTTLAELDQTLESIHPHMESSFTRSRDRDPGLRASRPVRLLAPECMRAYLDCAAIISFVPHLARTSSEGVKVIFALILEQDYSQQDLSSSMTSRRRAFLQGRAERDRSLEQLFDPIDGGHSTETPTPYNSARLRAASPHSHIPDIPANILTLEHILHIHSALWYHRRRDSGAENLDPGSPRRYLLRIKDYFTNGARELTVVMRLDSERSFHFEIYNRPSDPTGAQVGLLNLFSENPQDILAEATRENPRGVIWNHRVTLRRILREAESHPGPEENDYGVPVSEAEDSSEPVEPRVTTNTNFDYFTMGARSVR